MRLSELVPGMHRFSQGFDAQEKMKGWEYAKWGQNFHETKRFYPQAEEEDFKLTLRPQRQHEREYEITLGFDRNHQLETVTLTFAGSKETADFADMNRWLSARFGTPVSRTENTVTWQRDETNIEQSSTPGGGAVLDEVA